MAVLSSEQLQRLHGKFLLLVCVHASCAVDYRLATACITLRPAVQIGDDIRHLPPFLQENLTTSEDLLIFPHKSTYLTLVLSIAARYWHRKHRTARGMPPCVSRRQATSLTVYAEALQLWPVQDWGCPAQVDLLIALLQLPRIATLQEASLLPCIGNDAFAGEHGSICTELEIYGRNSDQFAIIQQRAPAATGRQEEYAASVAAFLSQAAQVREVRQAGLLHSCIMLWLVGSKLQVCDPC